MPQPSKPKRPYGGRNKLPHSEKKRRVVIYARGVIADAIDRIDSAHREGVLARGLDINGLD